MIETSPRMTSLQRARSSTITDEEHKNETWYCALYAWRCTDCLVTPIYAALPGDDFKVYRALVASTLRHIYSTSILEGLEFGSSPETHCRVSRGVPISFNREQHVERVMQ